MNNALETMLSRYAPANDQEKANAVKEIVQEIVLAGLSRGGFFKKAAFYGGTCLRIFHGLDRFSEDLDFVLIRKGEDFRLDSYFPLSKKELMSFGLEMEVGAKSLDKEVQSAFVKGGGKMLMMYVYPTNEEAAEALGNQKFKIIFEIDTANPEGGVTQTKYRLLPSPYEITVFDESTLFSGKVAAVLCREYHNRVKGRDFYDYLFYCGKGTKLNLAYLENKLKNAEKIPMESSLTIEMVKSLLTEKFKAVDYALAKGDVRSFIKNKDRIDIWCPELFLSTLENLQA